MNLLARAKSLTIHLHFSSPSLRKPPFHLHPFTTLQNPNFYSTKTQQSTKPTTQKPPSSTFSQRIKKESQELTNDVWPKPQQMPYEAKVANFVNLIGYIKMPALLETSSEGKHFATTVISVGESNCLSIPVVFEGDLAHMVACHVKENVVVFVSGLLSAEPIRLVLSESVGKFHVVAENVKLVEGLEMSRNVVGEKLGFEKNFKKVEEMVERVDNNVLDNSKLGFEKRPKSIERVVERVDNDVYKHIKTRGESSPFIESNVKPSVIANAEPEPEVKAHEKSGENVSKNKDVGEVLNLWRDLVKNPNQWWDFRDHKSKGLVKERYPDFKKKLSGESLWISTAPKWILPGIARLEFLMPGQQAPGQGGVATRKLMPGQQAPGQGGVATRKFGKSDDLWKNLVENHEKWYDNRANKRNPKSPDFKHKETGEALWVDNKLPAWVLAHLPPSRNTV